MNANPVIFFGVGTGRCGTMLLANLLNAESGVVALHEGKFRHREQAGDQVLPFLTLQNYHAYCFPQEAETILRKAREQEVVRAAHKTNAAFFGDIAYNYAPFVRALHSVFGDARLLVIYRDGRDFVRSAYTAESPDPTPVGWLDADRQLDRVERYIALGRLRPRPGDPLEPEWPTLTPVEKNAWLWAETNRLIRDGLQAWPREQVLEIRFEDLVAEIRVTYRKIRHFLGIEHDVSAAAEELMTRRINARSYPILPHWKEWDQRTTEAFWRFGRGMMDILGYE